MSSAVLRAFDEQQLSGQESGARDHLFACDHQPADHGIYLFFLLQPGRGFLHYAFAQRA
jgi:hypothetical protein